MAAAALTFDNPIFKCLTFYGSVVIAKLLFVGMLTSYQRITKRVFANAEDVGRFKGKVAVNTNHPDVERSRRNHLNDIENIIPFVLVGIMYVLTGPTMYAAQLHFRIFAATRFLHTFVYQFAIPQPARALCHAVSLGVTCSMLYQVIKATMSAM